VAPLTAARRLMHARRIMLTLYALAPAWGIAGIVPASMKLETWLRMAGLEYKIAPVDFSLAPKGKMPFVSIDGDIMGDSTLIIERLSRERGLDTDRGLSRSERAVSLAFRRMLKEHLYFALAHDRWVDDENFVVYGDMLRQLFFNQLPAEQCEPAMAAIRAETIAQLRGQGMGRHRPDEIHRLGMADLTALSDFLGDKPFLMGDEPTTVDATQYAYVANTIFLPLRSKLRDHGLSLKNLVAHCERMRARYFPELAPHTAA
jgi:glutathione S-transferase